VWDAQTGKPLTGLLKHENAVAWAQFSPDGKRIVTASWDQKARIWDAVTGQSLIEPMNHRAGVNWAQFSPDGKRVVTASDDFTARVWDAQTGLALTEPLTHRARVWCAQFSPDGQRIVTASEDSTARIWDIAPAQANGPDWLLLLAEATSGRVLNRHGILEETKLNRAETLRKMRQRLNRETNVDDWILWGRWFLADPTTRTISPFSKTTVAEYVEQRIEEHTLDSLDEAENLAAGNGQLLERISRLKAAFAQELKHERSDANP
jgi:WD40 repeat protein